MKIRPVILCGGSGNRLWINVKNHQAKQFIDFGDWTLLGRTLERIKNSIFDPPIISTNLQYLKEIKKHLKNHKIKKYKIVLEPAKMNTGPAILSAALIKDIPNLQPLVFLSADHLIEKENIFYKEIKKNKKYLSNKNIFIFGIKPTNASSDYGYFTTKKNKKINNVVKFIEKPNLSKAKIIIKKKGYWNSGMFFLRKDSIINNFKKHQYKTYKNCQEAVLKSKYVKNIYYLKKSAFIKSIPKSFDYGVLEKTKDINAIKLNIPWSDLGSWKEICKMYDKNKNHYIKKKSSVFYRPWGKYINIFNGKNFLIKEIHVKPKGILSLQKHFHRAEHWLITQGTPKITLNKKIFIKKKNDSIFIPLGAVHRIENPNNKTVKLIEAQLGSILKETDIVRFKDIYGRVN
ncbi:sugar phosphate nucleotidyltransferase [Pelagibacteraceae bacterium]|nr:sugar phosphate nucleotidyltransferase [Pelagibacteraceae bacterium]